jgi:GNAT superfamily N-acetyltransferase
LVTKFRITDSNDSEIVVDMVVNLLTELRGALVEKEAYLQASKKLLSENKQYTVFLAYTASCEYLGFISVFESSSIRTFGEYGVIQELFVYPEYRSFQIGRGLLSMVKNFAIDKGWKRLEVGAPNSEKWGRSVAFYLREGFSEVGPRLKLSI